MPQAEGLGATALGEGKPSHPLLSITGRGKALARLITLPPTMELDLVGAKDIATRAGVQVDTVHKWRKRGLGFPEPLAIISETLPVWEWSAVAGWLGDRKSGRVRGPRSDTDGGNPKTVAGDR